MTFEDYLTTLAPLSRTAPATEEIAEHVEIRKAAHELMQLPKLDREVLAGHVSEYPDRVPVLGLVVGLSRERLKNVLRHKFDTSGWITLARTRSADLIAALDDDFGLVPELEAQRKRSYSFGDVLVARAGSRQRAPHSVRRPRLKTGTL